MLHARPVRLLWVAALVGCASQNRLPPGNRLEFDPQESPAQGSSEAFVRPPGNESELAAAFDGPSVQRAVVPAPVRSPSPQAEETDPHAPIRAEFLALIKDGFNLLRRKDLVGAKSAVQAAWERAAKLGPPEAQQVAELETRAALTASDGRQARLAIERWMLSCGPAKVDRCRAKALAALAKLSASRLPEAIEAKEKLAAVRKADGCVRSAERAARARAPLPTCLGEIERWYRKQSDRLMLARVFVAQGRSAASIPRGRPEAIQLLHKADRACDERRCGQVRHDALKHLSALYLQADELIPAAKAAFQAMQVIARELPFEQRRYGRTPEVERVCAKLDASEKGACRRLERSVLGEYFFYDFSRENAGTGLSPQKVRAINEHFGVLLDVCLQQEAARLVPPAAVTYRLQWMVNPQGKVEQVRLDGKEPDPTPLADCIRAQFVHWRYPRYQGEYQHVEQTFAVHARQRR